MDNPAAPILPISPQPAVSLPAESPNRRWLIWAAGGLTLLFFGIALGVFGVKFFNQSTSRSQISSYEDCLAAKGSIVQESYPSTCVTASGQRFVQPLTDEEKQSLQPPDPYREPAGSAAAANWKTYTSEKFGFSFRYPETWKDVSDPKSATEFKIETTSNEVVLGTIFDGKADKAKDKSWIRNLDLINNKSILISYMQCAGMGCKEGSKDIAIFDQILSTFHFLK